MRHKLIDLYQYEDYYTYKKYNEKYHKSTKRSTNKLYLNCLKECVKIALEKELTGIEKECLIEYYYNEKKMQDIANKRGVTVSVISRHIKKGKEIIGEKLEYFEAIYKEIYNDFCNEY